MIAARAIVTPINTRLKPSEVAYIIEHSQCSLLLVDHEYVNLVAGTKLPVIVSNDTGRAGDPYEDFLDSGRRFSKERGWQGLESEPDENAAAVLCYTYVFCVTRHCYHFTDTRIQLWDHWTSEQI